jgi:hypothetical protein
LCSVGRKIWQETSEGARRERPMGPEMKSCPVLLPL